LNPNITWEIITRHPEKPWYWDNISRNPMTKAKNDFLYKKRKEYYSSIVHSVFGEKGIPLELVPVVMDYL